MSHQSDPSRISASPAPTSCSTTPLRPKPPIRISSHYGKMRTPTSPSCNKPKPNSPDCNKFLQILCGGMAGCRPLVVFKGASFDFLFCNVVMPLAPIFEGTGEPRTLRLGVEGSLFDFLLP